MTPAELIESHRRMVYAIAKQQRAKLPSEFDELVGDGMVALCEAAARFDPDRGVTFADYARKRIAGAMVDGHRRRYRTGHNHSKGEPIRFVDIAGWAFIPAGHLPRLGVKGLRHARVLSGSTLTEMLLPASKSAEDEVLERQALFALLERVAALPDPLRRVVDTVCEDGRRVGSAGQGDGRLARLAEREGVTQTRISQRLAEARRLLAAA